MARLLLPDHRRQIHFTTDEDRIEDRTDGLRAAEKG
jgi:hypothetical protein